jgi:hypothetical protein
MASFRHWFRGSEQKGIAPRIRFPATWITLSVTCVPLRSGEAGVMMMKLEDLFRSISTQSGRDILQAVSMVLDAEDISTTQRDAFICGYLAGLGYALYAGREGVEREILLRSQELGEEGWLSAP